MRALALILFLQLFLSACGHKGPLYIPQNPAPINNKTQEKP
ncbi:MAG: lipoprotein [Nitrosomonas sp.]|nr:lipoprotein [Nitrosomonas sp.]